MLRLRRAESSAEVLAVAAPYEPDTVRITADIGERGLGRHVRAWVVEDGADICGVVVVARLCRDRWYATPAVVDVAAGPLLASAVDASPAWEVTGGAAHVAALAPHLRRTRSSVEVDLVGAGPMSGDFLEQDPRCRQAGMADVDALVEVYAGFELEETPTRPRLRAFLARTLRHRPVVVLEEDGRIAAAIRCEFRSDRFDLWSGMTILPAFRGRKLYGPINNLASALTLGSGRGTCGTIAATNRMSPEGHPQAVNHLDAIFRRPWAVVRLQSPAQWPGARRARALVERVEGRLERRVPEIVR